MSTLSDLFPDGKRRSAEPSAHDESHRSGQGFAEMFGDRPAVGGEPQRTADRPALAAVVDAAVAEGRSWATTTPSAPKRRARRRRRPDPVDSGMAILAVAAIATATVIGGVQAATASPADDALQSLIADERTIEAAEVALADTRERLAESVADADARAATLRTALDGVREIVDPADIPEGGTEAPEDAGRVAIVDQAALDAAIVAVDAYRADLAALILPPLPAAYQRARIDGDELVEVAAAIDAAQQQLMEIDRTFAAVRSMRTAARKRATTYATTLTAFATTFPAAAQRAIDEHPDAEQPFKDAVAAAGDALAASDLTTEGADAALQGYRDAAAALVADQVRADRQREREEEERERAERERAERERAERERQQPEPTPTPSDQTEAPEER